MYIGLLNIKYPLFLSDVTETWIFSADNIQISKFMKIRTVGAELFREGRRVDGQTDMTKLIVAFRTFCSAYNKI